MIDRISYIESNTTNPYRNLALEEYLLFHCEEDECILYLWQNSNTVVIGKNQNAWRECRFESLEKGHGILVRRMSGGGAVYHDTGNLNFTFITREQHYDVQKQLDVIVDALRRVGIMAEKTGRNDITVEGRKVSGSAFYRRGDRCFHHGTIMVDVDIAKLSEYLTVSQEKLRYKGIPSVRSRVVNLTKFVPQLTVDVVKDALFESFENLYGIEADMKRVKENKDIWVLTEKYASWEWTKGRRIDFQHEVSHVFDWGQLMLQFNVNGGQIEDVGVFSDAMDPDISEIISGCIRGVRYDNKAISSALMAADCGAKSSCMYGVTSEEMFTDICRWLETIEL